MTKLKMSTMRRKRMIIGLLFISPWIIGFLCFFISPLIQTIRFSFGSLSFDDAGYTFSYLGIDNYRNALFVDVNYLPNLYNSLLQIVTNVPFILIFSFFAALLLKEKNPATNIAKVVFFLPVIMGSGVFMAYQASDSSVNSLINASIEESSGAMEMLSSQSMGAFLVSVGVPEKAITYITEPINNNFYSVIMMSGVQIFIFLAGLNSISPSLYEACFIEGGGKWETFWKITLPMMMPTLLINIIFSLIDTFTADSNIVMTQVYNLAFKNFQFGQSSAMCLIYVVILAVIMGTVGWLVNRKTFYYT